MTNTIHFCVFFICIGRFGTSAEERAQLDETTRHYYETTMSEWLAVEAIVRQRDKEKTAHAVAKLSSESSEHNKTKATENDGEIENDVFEENAFSDLSDPEEFDEQAAGAKTTPTVEKPSRINKSSTDSGNVPDEDGDTKPAEDVDADKRNAKDKSGENIVANEVEPALEHPAYLNIVEKGDAEENDDNIDSNKSSPSESSYETVANDLADLAEQLSDEFKDSDETMVQVASPTTKHAVIITDASVDIVNQPNDSPKKEGGDKETLSPLQEEATGHTSLDALQEPKSACVSPASSNGGIYSVI